MNNEQDTLNKYGTSFQLKIISSLLTDVKLIESLYETISPNFFDSDAAKWIVETILEYYDGYKKLPTMDVFKAEITKIDDEILKKLIVDNLRTIYTKIGTEDFDYVKKEFTEFCFNQNMKKAIIHSVDLMKIGNYQKIKELVDTALKVGVENDLGHDYIEDFSERNEEINRTTVPTDWELVNDLMDGGLGGGELGVVVSASGGGKSWVLCHLGAAALKLGYDVVHYTLELNEYYVGKRYDTIFTGIPSTDLEEKQEDVYKKIKNIPGKLLIKYFPPKGITSQRIELHIEKLIANGNKPGLVIIDYADLLLSKGGHMDSTYAEQGGIYVELRGLSGLYQIPFWTASQASRGAINEEYIQADKIADSYAKVMHSDFIISLSRKASDKVNETARFHIMKNRFGPDGLTFPAKMDTNTGMIEIYEGKSPEGIMAQKEASNGGESIEKQHLYKKYLNTIGTDNG